MDEQSSSMLGSSSVELGGAAQEDGVSFRDFEPHALHPVRYQYFFHPSHLGWSGTGRWDKKHRMVGRRSILGRRQNLIATPQRNQKSKPLKH